MRFEPDAVTESTLLDDKRQIDFDAKVIWGFVASIVVALFVTGYLAFGVLGLGLALGFLVFLSLVWGIATGMG
nr:hypothetical protein [uncultured bacterium]